MHMSNLIDKIEELKNSEISYLINNRIKEFKEFNNKHSDELFKEMCFCILTANFNAEKSIKIQNEIGECFLTDSIDELAEKLKDLGHRFPKTRAEYIRESGKCKDRLEEIIQSYDGEDLREWIVNNVKGLGYKEASHFLRNIGYTDFAIIDFHIINVLTKHKIVEKPKVISKKRYLKIEESLRKIARTSNLNLAELDLYLWHMETGKILK